MYVRLLVLVGFAAALARGEDPDQLHAAARAADAERVKALLAAGVPANHRDPLGGTALHDAAWSGCYPCVAALLEHGADPNARHTEAGSTPLHYAIVTHHTDIVKLLLDRGAEFRAAHRSGASPLHLAANRGYTDIAEFLI